MLGSLLKFKRKIKLSILDKESIERIHSTSLQILEKIGIKIYSEETVNILKDAGCQVDEKEKTAKIPSYLVEEALRKCPKNFKLYARNPQYDLPLNGEQTYIFTNGTCTLTIDLETGERRRSVKDDLVKTAILTDALEGMHGYYPVVVPSDYPGYLHGLHELEASLNYTEKHVMLGSTSMREEAKLQIKMAETVLGGEEELRKRPIITSMVCTTPPLKLDKEATEATLEFAKVGIPIRIMSMPLLGMSSPVTLASALSMANAEILGLLTIIQLAYPKTPIMYAVDPMGMEPKRGNFAPCLPSAILINCASIQLAKEYYGIPCGDGFSSASKVPDSQAAYENALTAFCMMAAGADVISGPGGLESYNVLSYEQFLIDYEICTMIFSILNGLEVNDETLALDLMIKKGHEGVFISEKHTLKHFRELWVPMIADFNSYEMWIKEGNKDMVQRAKEKVKEILETHKPTPLEPEIQEKLKEILKEGEEKIPH